MTGRENSENTVRIYEPDRSLQIKVGVTNLDQVFTAKAVSAAQAVIEESSESFLNDSLSLMDELLVAYQAIRNNPVPTKNPFLSKIVDTSFMIKTKTGQSGYTLASILAKSLQLHAEQAEAEGLGPKTIDLLGWHVESLQQFLKMKVKGTGGDIGAAIMKEIQRVAPIQAEQALRVTT